MNAILDEAVELDRATEMIYAMLDVYQQLVPILITPLGMGALSQCVQMLAHPDNTGDQDIRRAAQLVVAHSQDNIAGINDVIREIKELDRVTPLILAVLNLYRELVPVLATPIGLASLTQTVLDLAVKENAVQ